MPAVSPTLTIPFLVESDPSANRLAARVRALLEYLLRVHPASDTLLRGLIGGLLDPAVRLSLVAHGDSDTPAWAALTDPQFAPLWALPYAAQWTGGVPPARQAGEPEEVYLARARADVVAPRGMRRGSAVALRIAAEPHVTGTRTVRVVQRLGGSIWHVGVLVIEEEVPSLDALTTAINNPEVITAGMKAVIQFIGVVVWTIAELEDLYYTRTLADLEGDYATVHDLELNEPV